MTELPLVFQLVERAQQFEQTQRYWAAAYLYRKASEQALTPAGAHVLRERADDAIAKTRMPMSPKEDVC